MTVTPRRSLRPHEVPAEEPRILAPASEFAARPWIEHTHHGYGRTCTRCGEHWGGAASRALGNRAEFEGLHSLCEEPGF